METKAKSDRKQQIIAVAEEMFSKKGYLATSMRDLAEALDIEAASLYSHYAGKEDLLWQIASRCATEFFDAIRPIHDSAVQNMEQKLTDMIIAHVEVITRNMRASAVFFHEWTHLNEPHRSEYAQLRDEYEAIFRDVIRKGVEENLFLYYDDAFSARTVLSALNWTHTWYRPDGELRPHQIGERLAQIMLNGLIRKI